MDSVREQIINEQARSKVRTEELYNIIKQIDPLFFYMISNYKIIIK